MKPLSQAVDRVDRPYRLCPKASVWLPVGRGKKAIF